MAYVQVPKDLTRVKTKVLFNLTKRQLICFGSAAAVSVPFYLLTRHSLGSTLAACIMIVIALPFFLFAMYEKDGRPLEKILKNIIQMKFKRPGVRPYKTDNFYEEAAAVVKEIFRMCMEGMGPGHIAAELTKRKILTPAAHQAKMGRKIPQKPGEFPCHWHSSTVAHILEHREYTGCTVNFKTYINSIWDKKLHFNKTFPNHRTIG